MRNFLVACFWSSTLLLTIGCAPSLYSRTENTSDIVEGMTKESVRATSGLEETSGKIVHDGREYEYATYFRFPSTSNKHWSTDRSAWIVLYDADGRVVLASDDWSTLPEEIVEPIRNEYRAKKDEELRKSLDASDLN